MKTLITIGVAVYNIEEKILTECIESIISNRSDSFEIIIVNDCSTNGCGSVCKKYADSDGRIVYIELAQNRGIGYVRNHIIENANGEWIVFVDGDDIIYGDFEESVKCENAHDSDLLIYDYASFKENQKFDGSFYNGKSEILTKEETERFCAACLTEAPCSVRGKTLSKGCTAKAYKREFLFKNNIRFIENLKISEDAMFYADALHYCKKAVYFPFTLYYYRSGNCQSVTNRFNPDSDELKNYYMLYASKRIADYFPGRENIADDYCKFKIGAIIYRECKLNFFHKNNPKGIFERRKEFMEFLSKNPYKESLEKIVPREYDWRERTVIFNLLKKKRFFMLELVFKRPIILNIYCGAAHRAEKITRRDLP